MYYIQSSIQQSMRMVYMHKWATPQEGSIEYIQMDTKKKEKKSSAGMDVHLSTRARRR